MRAVREKGKKGSFLFLEEKIRRYLLYLLDDDSSRSVATAVLGRRRRRENSACANCGTEWETQLVEG